MPERRRAVRLQGVPDPRAGIDAGGTSGAGVTGAGPRRAASLSAAGAEGPFDLDRILAVARSVGLDAERLVREMEDPSLDALIEQSGALAMFSASGERPRLLLATA